MSEDKELKAMAAILPLMEPLGAEERKRVIVWLAQKLSVEVAAPRVAAQPKRGSEPADEGAIDLSTDTIATILGTKSGPELIIAAAAHLHFTQGKSKFTRQEITAQMRAAPGHFKDTYVNNLSSYLNGLKRLDRLRLVSADTYSLPVKERQELEARLADA